MPKRGQSNSSHGPAKKSKASVPSEAATDILDLNDDCLGHIFSFLELIDLCAVKETCRRFEAVANDHFQRKYCHDEFDFDAITLGRCDDSSSKIFRLFGKLMRELSVIFITAAQQWNLICTNGMQLKKLTLRWCDLNGIESMKVAAEPTELDNLKIIDCKGDSEHFATFFSYFNSERLTVQQCFEPVCEAMLLRNFPQLKEITFKSSGAEPYFNDFIRLNPQIEKVVVYDFAVFPGKMTALYRLENLKELLFSCKWEEEIASAINKLAERNTLETLALTNGIFSMESCEALCKLSKLKTLKLIKFSGLNTDHLRKILSEIDLTNIQIIHCKNVKYEDIAAVISCSRKLESMAFVFVAVGRRKSLCDECSLQLAKSRELSLANCPMEFHQTKGADRFRSSN